MGFRPELVGPRAAVGEGVVRDRWVRRAVYRLLAKACVVWGAKALLRWVMPVLQGLKLQWEQPRGSEIPLLSVERMVVP